MIERQSLFKKLVISNLTYALPFVVVIGMLGLSLTRDIDFAQKERSGNAFERPLADLLQDLALYNVHYQSAHNGNGKVKSELAGLEGKIDVSLNALDSALGVHGENLDATEAGLRLHGKNSAPPSQFRSLWVEIKKMAAGSRGNEGPAKSLVLFNDIKSLITHIGDTSNLILDPDLDSFYVMDASLIGSVELLAITQDLTLKIEALLGAGRISMADQLEIAVLLNRFRTQAIDRIEGDLTTAQAEDAKFHGRSESFQSAANTIKSTLLPSFRAFADRVQLLNQGRWNATEGEALVQMGVQSIVSARKINEATIGALDTLLESRVSDLERRRSLEAGLALLALIAASAVCFWIARKISAEFAGVSEDLRLGSKSILEMSQELDGVSQKVSAASAQQSATVQETVSASAEMNSMILQTNQAARSSLDLARSVSERTEEGKVIMQRMVTSMESIQQANAQLQNIATIITEITSKTAVINDIVFKTQLLSFNASIEAARAGQHGRGFAVVAEEVGNLAQMSGNAAREIQNLLADSQKQVTQILDATQDRVSEGQTVSSQALTTFNQITSSIDAISKQVHSITDATREQEVGIKQTTVAMQQLDTASRTNDLVAQQAARVARDMHGESVSLKGLMESTIALVRGENHRLDSTGGETTEASDTHSKRGVRVPLRAVEPIDEAGSTKSRNSSESGVDSESSGNIAARILSSDRSQNKIDSLNADSDDFKKSA
jgi:methyl-accepting chemotaxis protein